MKRLDDIPKEDIFAGNDFRDSMVPYADQTEPSLMWHGWVIMDAFLAGIEYAEKKLKDKQNEE